MNTPDYNSPQALKALLDENGMAMQKKFGQNFMVNPSARTRIVDMLGLESGQRVWEVGPGLGCMTAEIMSRGADIKVFEIDRGFINLLRTYFADEENTGRFEIVQGDVLKTWKNEAKKSNGDGFMEGIKLFGNLPYNIAATFIADTIARGFIFDRCVFTVQKEVTERICAKPGTKNYSSFTVLCQWKYVVSSGIELAAGNFWPRPNVASQAVLFERREKPLECSDSDFFVKFVHALFSNRRKTVSNNLKSMVPATISYDEIFDEACVSKSERAENISVEGLLRLSEVCLKKVKENSNKEQ